MKAEIVSIGTELLLGEITDTNASYLASQLPLLGIDLHWISQVGDHRDRLVEALQRAWQRSELILTTGGLGPTDDDLTREAIAELLGEQLECDPYLERKLRERFAQLGIAMPVSNLKQVMVIPSAQPLTNPRGTAPGWWVERDGRILVAMPGPPGEMQEMWQRQIQPRLRQVSESTILCKTFKTFGLSEAAVGELAFPLFSSANPALGVYAKADGIHLRLTAKADNPKQAAQLITDSEAAIRAILGKYIWGTDNETLETVIGQILVARRLSLAVMEDYSGGLLAATITEVPQSQTFFKGGLVASSDDAKVTCGVNAEAISRFGAASPEIAQAMAQAARTFFSADIGIGITGLKEATGVAYIGLTDGRTTRVVNRIRGRRRVTTAALFELRELLLSRA